MSSQKPPSPQTKATAKRAAAQEAVEAELQPAKPEGYEPEGEVKVLAENKGTGIRVVSDDVRVWKERTK